MKVVPNVPKNKYIIKIGEEPKRIIYKINQKHWHKRLVFFV